MASVAAEQEEEVGVAVKKFSWQKAVWGPTHRVISATDAQYRYSCLVHIPEWVVVFPVGVPADGETLGVAEEGLLKLSQGAAPEQFSGVHYVLQGCGIPAEGNLLVKQKAPLVGPGQAGLKPLTAAKHRRDTGSASHVAGGATLAQMHVTLMRLKRVC